MTAPREKFLTSTQAIPLLPFVKDLKPEGSGRDWWNVPTADDYSMQCIIGAALGNYMVNWSRKYEARDGGAPVIQFVLESMVKRGIWSGTEAQFCRQLAEAVIEVFGS